MRGRVLPIGGLKEKSLAAYRGGIRRIIIPKDNLRDIEDVPAEVAEKIQYIPAADIDSVLENILVSPIGK